MASSGDIERLSSALVDGSGLKLWSVIVTILGDMAHGGHDEVSGPALSAIIAEMGLRPQAMRVALHRLKRDGWIEARHSARIGYYALSEKGLRETKAVTARVYGPVAQADARLVVLAPGVEVPPGAVPLARRTVLVEAGAVPPDAVLARMDTPLPTWAIKQLQDAACDTPFAQLYDLLGQIGHGDMPLMTESLTLRMLILHSWRRLVLRSNPVAETLLGAESAAHRCRAAVTAWLEKLPLPDAKDLKALHP